MQYNATPDLQDSGTTDDRGDDCACTPLLACWQHFRDGDRGRPAVRQHTEDA